MAVQYGFNSVMIDASVYPNDENIARTQEVVKLARPLNITVEAEIGHVGVGSKYSIKDYSKYYTDPQEAQHFVAVTGVDALAVAVGTAHGVYKGVPKIDFDRLKELKATLQMPLVLHGGSGTGDENLQKAVEYGINKVNLYTDLHSASYEQLVKTIQEKPKAILIELQEIIENAFKEKLQYYMRLFGSAGRA
jgi:fructose-bisphosphate aldolase class II